MQHANYTVSTKKTAPLDNVRRIIKSERILTKFRVLDYEYICDRIAKCHKKIFFITRVINIQILTTKYFTFHSATYCSQALKRPKWRNERKQKYVRLRQCIMKHQTSSLQLCGQLTVLTLTLSTTRFGESCRSVCDCVPQPDSWRRPAEVAPDRRVGIFPPGGHRWSGQAVATTSSSLRSSTRWTFWTQTLGVLTSCHSHGRTLDSQSRLCLLVDTYAFKWPY